MSNVYGGDEVNALVADLGSCLCKIGYGGDDAPKAFFPSSVGVSPSTASPGAQVPAPQADDPGPVHISAAARQRSLQLSKGGMCYSVGDQALSVYRDGMEVISPYSDDGLLSEWDVVEALYNYGFRDRLGAATSEYAVLASEPSHSGASTAGRASREKHVEMLFETFGVPAAFLSKAAVLASFAVAKQTGVVVDMGHQATTVSIVHDGYVLNKCLTRLPLGGLMASKALKTSLDIRGTRLRPRRGLKRAASQDVDSNLSTSASYNTFQVLDMVTDIKHTQCKVCESRFNEAQATNLPEATYELPDGQMIQVGLDRFRLPELFFQPDMIKSYPGVLSADTELVSLPEAILNMINTADVDLRKDLYPNIVLTGGGSLMPGSLRDRLDRELGSALGLPSQAANKCKITAASNGLERRFGVWIGGSILSSLGTFQQLWLSKAEYAEHGAGLIHKRSP